MTEQTGLLTERVRFEERSKSRGPYGEQSEQWDFVFERWASVKTVTRSDPLPVAADTRHMARRWTITIRSGRTPGLDMRAIWRDLTLAIIAVESDPAKPGWIMLQAEDFAPTGR